METGLNHYEYFSCDRNLVIESQLTTLVQRISKAACCVAKTMKTADQERYSVPRT